ncbi:MAG: TonB-dependent receptor [Acidobacteriota bacterium]
MQASRTEQPASAIPSTVVLIDQETVAATVAISDELSSVLSRTVPGFSPGIQKLTGRSETLRGRNPLYLVDSVPQHNALRDGSRDGHTFDSAFIERIEVINGSNAIQGVGATGGVVNTVTRSPVLGSELKATFDLRANGADDLDSDSLGYKTSGLVSGGNDRAAVLVGASLFERGLFFDADGNPVGLYPTQGDIMDSQTLSLFAKGRFQLGESVTLDVMGSDFDLERNGDFRAVLGDRAAGIPTTTIEGDPSADVGSPARNENTVLSATLIHESLGGGRLTAQLFAQSFKGLFEGGTFGTFFRLTPEGGPFLDQSAVESDKTGVKLAWDRDVSAQLQLTAGLDYFLDDSAQVLDRSGREWVPETTFETLSPFVQLGYDVGERLSLSLGGRLEDASLEVDDYTTIAAANSTFVSGGSPEFDEFLINAGVVFRAADEVTLYAAVSEGFTMPDVGRVLRGVNVPGQDVDTLFDLEPVIAENFDLGAEFFLGRFQARIAYFESEADNGARLLSNEQGIFEVQRQRTEIDGFEISADYYFSEKLQIAANYADTNGEFDSDADGRVDTDLDGLNIGPNRLNLIFESRLTDDFSGRLQVSTFEDRDFRGLAAAVGRDFDGFTLVDLALRYQLPVGALRLGVENLLNEDYFTYFAQIEPFARADTFFKGNGRTVSVAWRVDL